MKKKSRISRKLNLKKAAKKETGKTRKTKKTKKTRKTNKSNVNDKLDFFKKRDGIIYSYLRDRSWDDDPEFLLMREASIIQHKDEKKYMINPKSKHLILLDKQEKPSGYVGDVLKKFPYTYEHEWFVYKNYAYMGKGDIIMTDGKNSFLVVEFKYIDPRSAGKTQRVKRTKKRKEVKEQAKFYVEAFRKSHPNAKVSGMAYTNEEITLV